MQKYFIKLANAGLPVPGRMPNMANYPKKKVSHMWCVPNMAQLHVEMWFSPDTGKPSLLSGGQL